MATKAKQEFHQERIVNGVLSHRTAPNKPWVAYTSEELTKKIEEVQIAAQLEYTETQRDVTKEIATAVKAAVETEKQRILKIVDTEEEPGETLTEDQKTMLDSITRVDLANLVVRVTKQSIRKRIETV